MDDFPQGVLLGAFFGICLTVMIIVPICTNLGKEHARKEALSHGYGHIDSELKFQWNTKEK